MDLADMKLVNKVSVVSSVKPAEFSQQSQAMVNTEERIADMKRWKEMMDTGINIDYRCVKCRNCADCRNADETERVSLRQDVEDAKIKESVHIDYENRKIMATLPLRGKEEDFLVCNRDRAICILNQQCRKFHGKEEDRKLVLSAFRKLFDRGYMVLLKNISEDLRKKFEGKYVQHYIPWRCVYNPKSKSTPVRPVMDAS